jgi:hypothetical protein
MKENVWKFELEEEVDYYLKAAGIDSVFFMFTFGLPLYIFVLCKILAFIFLPIINFCIRTGCSYETDVQDHSQEESVDEI